MSSHIFYCSWVNVNNRNYHNVRLPIQNKFRISEKWFFFRTSKNEVWFVRHDKWQNKLVSSPVLVSKCVCITFIYIFYDHVITKMMYIFHVVINVIICIYLGGSSITTSLQSRDGTWCYCGSLWSKHNNIVQKIFSFLYPIFKLCLCTFQTFVCLSEFWTMYRCMLVNAYCHAEMLINF